ncbi:MAG: cyclic GMP-AMP synthase DncV-like nucleotidyltransferase, partial [Bacteroidota bacterium]
PKEDEDGNKLLEYDLDDGIYFLEKEDENNRRSIDTWHDWVYEAVKDHTTKEPEKKNSCVRVFFADDGHHIDLPIYYKDGDVPELADKKNGWRESDPKAFYEWFNDKAKKNQQLRRFVRYLKAWKNFQEDEHDNQVIPCGFILTILANDNYRKDDNDDVAFKNTLKAIREQLGLGVSFKCYRPTKPTDENLLASYSNEEKEEFLSNLDDLITACDNAAQEENFKKASHYLIEQLGSRFPEGKDEDEKSKNSRLNVAISTSTISPRPYSRQ